MRPERIGHTYDLGTHNVSQEQLDEYAAIAGGPTPVFAIVPVWRGIQEVNVDPELDVDIGRIVHGEQRMEFSRPIAAGDVLKSVGTIESLTDRGANEVLVMRLETFGPDDEAVCTQRVVSVSRGTAQNPPPAAGARKPERRGAPEPGSPDAVRKTHLAKDITFRYAKASGDDNKIHTDPEFARQVGLPGIIVQGMCMLHIATRAVVEEVAGADPGRVSSLSVRFASMLQPGSDLVTRIWRTATGATFESIGPDGKQVLREGLVNF